LAPLFLAQTKTDTTGEFIDKAARTPQSQIVIFVAVLTLVRVGLFLWGRGVPPHKRHGVFTIASGLNEFCDAIIYAAIFVFLVIRPYVVQAFKIPSGSMVSTLLVQDYIVANKFAYRFSNPKYGDIVVFRPPVDAIQEPKKQIDPDGQVNVDYVKRCIGVPGDLIEFKQNVLYRNGVKVDEPYRHFTQLKDFVNETYREDTAEEFEAEPKIDFKLVNYNGHIWPLNISGSIVNTEPFASAARYIPSTPEENRELLSLPAVKVPDGYYLMVGDNRNHSFDGRFWGLVPRDDIVGKAEFIWFPLSRFGPIHSGPKAPGDDLSH
jgi:signal peptidase I